MSGHILVVDDDRSMCEMLEESLVRRDFRVTWRTLADEALELAATEDFDVVVTDVRMRGTDGITLCTRIVETRPDLPVLVLTAFGSLETAVAAMRAGAYDFLTKPFELDALILALKRALQHRALREEVKRLRRVVNESQHLGEIVGTSPPMRRLFDLIERVSATDASVLIRGESGTGKELVAQVLHRRGRRASGRFVAVNCAAMPENLLESELFGHARGAFTDARTARPGLFVQAHGGTLFLDEIAELPLGLQPKLLRALQERTVRPVGGDAEVPVDVRIITATHRDLEAAIEERRFREDLYFRIHVIPIHVPPLRMRGNDILLLAQHFVGDFAAQTGKQVRGLTSAAAETLLAYSWPGNVRELRNSMERAVALTRYEQITVVDLPERIRERRRARFVTPDDPAELLPLEEVERRYIMTVLEAVGGNKTLAARVLGLDRKTLYRKLERVTHLEAEASDEPR